MKKWIVGGVVLLALAAAVYVKFFASRKNNGPKTVAVRRGTLVEKALATGEIVPRHEIAIKSKLSGTVGRLFVDEGDRVKAGDPLIEIAPSPTPVEYAQARRTLEMKVLAEDKSATDLKRSQELFDKGMVARSDYDAARQAYEQAVLNRKLAEEELDILDKGHAVVAGRAVKNIITSPISGYVLSRLVDKGDPVVPLTSYQPGTELMTIANMDDLIFKGTVDEIDVGKIREGMPAELKLGAFPDRIVTGKLSKIALKSEQKDNATVFDVEIDSLVAPHNTRLRSGYSANADIIVKRAKGVLILPERVLEYRGDSTFVRLAPQPGGKPREVHVQVGLSDGINFEVVGGLHEGDRVMEKEIKEIQ